MKTSNRSVFIVSVIVVRRVILQNSSVSRLESTWIETRWNYTVYSSVTFCPKGRM
jgi:hypothetical protein